MDSLKHVVTDGDGFWGYARVWCFDCNKKGGGSLLAQEGGVSAKENALSQATVSLLMEVARTHASTNGTQGHEVVLFEWQKGEGQSKETTSYFD